MTNLSFEAQHAMLTQVASSSSDFLQYIALEVLQARNGQSAASSTLRIPTSGYGLKGGGGNLNASQRAQRLAQIGQQLIQLRDEINRNWAIFNDREERLAMVAPKSKDYSKYLEERDASDEKMKACEKLIETLTQEMNEIANSEVGSSSRG
jgi:hypothetical protein